MTTLRKFVGEAKSSMPLALATSLSLIALSVAHKAYAATTFKQLVCEAVNLTSALISLTIGLALLAFIWGLVKFIYWAGSKEKRDEGKKVMLWGIIAMFVIVSLWGIVSFLQFSVFGSNKIDKTLSPDPCVFSFLFFP